eukprot:4376000-Prymnesium_polylepis.1
MLASRLGIVARSRVACALAPRARSLALLQKREPRERQLRHERAVSLPVPGEDATPEELHEYIEARVEARHLPSYEMLLQLGKAVMSADGDAKLAYSAHRHFVTAMRPIGSRAISSLLAACTKTGDYETLLAALGEGARNQLFFTGQLWPLLRLVRQLNAAGEWETLEKAHGLVWPALVVDANGGREAMLHLT